MQYETDETWAWIWVFELLKRASSVVAMRGKCCHFAAICQRYVAFRQAKCPSVHACWIIHAYRWDGWWMQKKSKSYALCIIMSLLLVNACDPCWEIARLPMLQQEAFQSDGNQSTWWSRSGQAHSQFVRGGVYFAVHHPCDGMAVVRCRGQWNEHRICLHGQLQA